MENTIFVLGAHDPEMKKIEDLLILLGYPFSYALQGVERSNVSNAYKSTHFDFFESSIIYIECNAVHKSNIEILIDHHNPGDYGYDLDYNQFVEASSVGQFFRYILLNDYDYVTTILNLKTKPIKSEINEHMYYEENDGWYLDTEKGSARIPDDVVLLSGIDHCLIDAYKGKCKGINTNNLFNVRVKQISEDLNVPEKELWDIANKYENKIRYFGKILDFTDLNMGNTIYSPKYLILRELSISKNVPIALKITYDGLEKIMFLSLEKNEVEELLKVKEFKGIKLHDMFGVPNRGYAGGFIIK